MTEPWPTWNLNLSRKSLVLAAETCERAWELLRGITALLDATFGVTSPQGRYSDRIRRFQVVRGVFVSDAAAALQTKEPASFWSTPNFLEEFLPKTRLPKRFSTQVKAKILTGQDEAIWCLELLLGLYPSLGSTPTLHGRRRGRSKSLPCCANSGTSSSRRGRTRRDRGCLYLSL